jgi:hypothetical protein
MSNTIAATPTISMDTATADWRFPTLNSKNTLVESTSVRMRVEPAKTSIGPNSPIDRAQAMVVADSTARQA